MKTRLLAVLACLLSFAGLNAQTVPMPDHVVVVVMENHGYSEIIGANTGAPYINSLAVDSYAASFTNSLAITHPSQPNYLYLFSGNSQGVLGDLTLASFQLPLTSANLGAELLGAGRTFKAYSEDLPSVGFTGDTYNNYARKHAPWVNWQGASTNGIPATLAQPFDSFPANYNNLPTLCWVIPNLQDDMHDGTIAQGDTWLHNHMAAYIQWAKTHNSLLILTYDEDENAIGNSTPITTIFIGQMVKMGQYSEQIDHNRVLRTMEDMYGLGHAGASSTPSPITDCWVYKPVSALNASPVSVCQGQPVTVVDSSANTPMAWWWSFPGGSPPTATGHTPPTVTYDTAGSYNMTLVTYNHMGYDTLVKNAYITVTAYPSITVAADTVSICQGSNAIITASGAASYTWLPAAGIISSNNNTLTASPSFNTTYYVTGSTHGCPGDTALSTVVVNPTVTPSVNISASPSVSVCQGSTVLQTAVPVNGGSAPVYQWQVNGVNVGSNSPVFSTYASSAYAVKCIITSNALCVGSPTATSNTLNISVNPTQTSSFNASVCAGNSYSFKGQSLSAAGSYPDTLSSVNGCDSIVTLHLSINALPVVNWGSGADTVYANSSAIALTGGNPAGGVFAGAGVSSNTFYPDSVGPGSYIITYTYTYGNGCSNTAEKTYVVIATGINNLSGQPDLVLYPNPVKNELMVISYDADVRRGRPLVFDVTGRCLMVPVTTRADGFTIDTRLLASGNYLIKMNVQGNELIRMFIKGE